MRHLVLAAVLVLAALGAQAATPSSCDEAAALHAAGQYGEAVTRYTDCLLEIENDPAAMADAYHRRGRASMKAGDLDAAITDYTLTIFVKPDHAAAWNSRAWAHYLAGRHEMALADVEQALVFDPDSVRTVDTRAHILAALGREEEAMVAFEQAMALHDAAGIAKTQDHLRLAGYDPGPSDGIYGPRTRAALAACVADACNIWN